MSDRRPDQRSPEAKAYRRLYNTARWKRIKQRQRKIEPLCRMCLAENRLTQMDDCDHIDPKSKETEAGFFAGPFQSLCKLHHASTKQIEERRGYVVGCDASGRPRDESHPWNAR